MKHIVFDIEADGLLPELTTIHSLILHDLQTGQRMSCTDNSPEYYTMSEGLEVLGAAERIYGHNILGYDLPALRKIYPWWDTKAVVLDTFVAACMRWAHIKDLDYDLYHAGKLPAKFIGRQSLEAWGWRLGLHKIEFEGPWDQWTPVMQAYCEQDVGVNVELVEKIRKSGVTQLSLEIEHKLRLYLLQQEENGWPFDLEQANEFYAMLSGEREGVEQKLIEKYGTWLAADGKPKVVKRDRVMRKGKPAPEHYFEGAEYQKLKVITFNPGSRSHIAKVLREQHGWVPTEFTETGLAKVDETILKQANLPEGDLIIEYLTLDKRIGQLAEGDKAWLKMVTRESPSAQVVGPVIHHQVWQNFCRTSRASHRNPNVAQVPANRAPYGERCRKLFTVPDGWTMLGADADGLELRCLANRLAQYDQGKYAEALLRSDIHIFNRDLLDFPQTAEGRDDSKTFSYALIYGAGDENLGSIVEPKASSKRQRTVGKKLRRRYEENLPAYKKLVGQVKGSYKRHGYVRLLDGRRAYPSAEYAALNTMLQGDGAVICKLWLVTFAEAIEQVIGPQGWGRNWAALGWIHDEVQLAVRPEYADTVGSIIVNSMERVTEELKVRLPLTASYKTGSAWHETH